MIDNSPFNWSGTCKSCGMPTDKLSHTAQRDDGKRFRRLSRGTVILSGKHEMADGAKRTFPAGGERVEVCYRCLIRWRRYRNFTGILAPRLARMAPTRKLVRKLARAGLSAADITRVVHLPSRTVSEWVRADRRSSTPRTTSSSARASKGRSS